MAEAEPAQTFTDDNFLGGRVVLRQPRDGYRAAIDPVLLAAAVPAEPHQRVLDVGCGAGAASLCLASRVEDIRVVGLELDRGMARLAQDNAILNGLGRRFEAVVGDLQKPPPRLAPHSFDHVLANPPYFEASHATSPGHAGRAQAHIQADGGLAAWVAFALRMARPGASFTLIHRAERLAELLDHLDGCAGDVTVFPLWPRDPFGPGARPAKRVIVQARAGSRGAMRLVGGLVLHGKGDGYTDAADAILRAGAPLPLRDTPVSSEEGV